MASKVNGKANVISILPAAFATQSVGHSKSNARWYWVATNKNNITERITIIVETVTCAWDAVNTVGAPSLGAPLIGHGGELN